MAYSARDAELRGTPPASRGQLIFMLVAAIIGITVGVSMFLVDYAFSHSDNPYDYSSTMNIAPASVYTAYISTSLGLILGLIAFDLLIKRRRFLKRAAILTMAADYPSDPAEREIIAAQAAKFRDASIASGDLDTAYRLNHAISQLESG